MPSLAAITPLGTSSYLEFLGTTQLTHFHILHTTIPGDHRLEDGCAARDQRAEYNSGYYILCKMKGRKTFSRAQGKAVGGEKEGHIMNSCWGQFSEASCFCFQICPDPLHTPGRRGLSQWSLEKLPCSERSCYSSLLLRLRTAHGNLFCSVQHLGTYKIQRGRDHIRQLLCGTQLICGSPCVQLAVRSLYPEGFSFD